MSTRLDMSPSNPIGRPRPRLSRPEPVDEERSPVLGNRHVVTYERRQSSIVHTGHTRHESAHLEERPGLTSTTSQPGILRLVDGAALPLDSMLIGCPHNSVQGSHG